MCVTDHQFPESVTQKAGPVPGAGFLTVRVASEDANTVDINAPIAEDVPFPPETSQPATTVFHFADVAPALVSVALEKFSTSESKALSLDDITPCLLILAGIMQWYLPP